MPAIVIPAPINSNHVAPVTAGGTGASTAANARTNLDVYSKSEVTSAIAQSTAWTRIANEGGQLNQTFDKTITVPSMANAKEVMFTVQRSDNGRTIASTIVPYGQFSGGAIYATGYGTLANTPTDTTVWVNAVAIWVSATSVQIVCNTANTNAAFSFRIFIR